MFFDRYNHMHEMMDTARDFRTSMPHIYLKFRTYGMCCLLVPKERHNTGGNQWME